jgi:hypothetical protein
MQVFPKPQDPKEELSAIATVACCLKCAGSNLAKGKWHQSGNDTWLRLFMCLDCKVESAI